MALSPWQVLLARLKMTVEMYFSEAFSIHVTAKDDWFDPILNADTKVFVDPFMIFQDDNRLWSGAHGQLIEHFNYCFHLIAQGKGNPKTLHYQKAVSLLHFPEPREFCLGYTAEGTRGAGGSVGYARQIAKAMAEAIERGVKDLRHFEELGILNEGVGPDRISDLTCNVLKDRFIAYTLGVAKRHRLPIVKIKIGRARFDTVRKTWRSVVVELPLNQASNRAVILVPARFLSDLPVLNAHDWWASSEAAQLRNDLNYEVMGSVNKATIVALARRAPGVVQKWSINRETSRFAAYDFEKDPKGVWSWDRAARQYVKTAPLVIRPARSDKEFVAVIQLIIDQFRRFIEEQGGWKLLWNDNGEEKPEEAAQLAFRGIAQHYCQANNIVIDREVELGRGPVDFKFSNGYSNRALL